MMGTILANIIILILIILSVVCYFRVLLSLFNHMIQNIIPNNSCLIICLNNKEIRNGYNVSDIDLILS